MSLLHLSGFPNDNERRLRLSYVNAYNIFLLISYPAVYCVQATGVLSLSIRSEPFGVFTEVSN